METLFFSRIRKGEVVHGSEVQCESISSMWESSFHSGNHPNRVNQDLLTAPFTNSMWICLTRFANISFLSGPPIQACSSLVSISAIGSLANVCLRSGTIQDQGQSTNCQPESARHPASMEISTGQGKSLASSPFLFHFLCKYSIKILLID